MKHLLSDPRFGSDESDISKVYLTEKGVEMFGKILYQRPILKGNEKPKPNAVNEFISPPIQVKYYFNKFGKDGVILSPSDSFEEMRTLYVEGLRRITEKLRCENINENYSKKTPLYRNILMIS